MTSKSVFVDSVYYITKFACIAAIFWALAWCSVRISGNTASQPRGDRDCSKHHGVAALGHFDDGTWINTQCKDGYSIQ
jgi:hypothetical protein